MDVKSDEKGINLDLLEKIKKDKAEKRNEAFKDSPLKPQEEAPSVQIISTQTNLAPAKSSSDLESQMQSLWNIPKAALNESKRYASQIRMTHGMLAAVPILCKDQDCPYNEICTISPQNRVIGQRCPMEAAALIARFQEYCGHFDLNMSTPTPEEVVDMTLVNDLVEIEVQMLRASNRIAINGDFISQTIGSVDQKGTVYYEDALDPAVDYIDRLKEKRYKIYRLLDSTRKDKASKAASENNPSVKAANLFSKIREAMNQSEIDENNIVPDVDYQVVDDTEDNVVDNTPTEESQTKDSPESEA